jgi:mannosyl-3-phosphoglycerate phosphatase family protein
LTARGFPLGLLFTDLDGTLLDHHSYQPSEEALEAVADLRRSGVWTIPVSSKTRAELIHLSETAAFAALAVVEGGAVLVDTDGSSEVVGLPRSRLVEILEEIRSRGVGVRGFSAMPVAEVCARTGLSDAAARRAMEREASEPFVVTEPDPPGATRLVELAATLGVGLERGGRFWHLVGRDVDKGAAVGRVLDRLDPERSLPTAAVGDAWNDLPMLAAVDHAFLLGEAVTPEETPPGVLRLPTVGPEGFCDAIRRLRNGPWKFAGPGPGSIS